jgi:hypothetical protein
MVLLASTFSKSSITADTASRKDLTLQGCTKVITTRTYTQAVEKPLRLPVLDCSHFKLCADEVSDTTVTYLEKCIGGPPR